MCCIRACEGVRYYSSYRAFRFRCKPKRSPPLQRPLQVRVVDEDMPWPAELASLGLASRVRLLRGSVAQVHRARQCVTLSPGGGTLPYDVLVVQP